MKKALIIGASGLVGSYLLRKARDAYETIGTFHNCPASGLIKLDVTDNISVKKTISEFDPDFVFFLGAMANVDLCEQEKGLCRLVNVEGVKNVAFAVKECGSKLIFYSTDYVFDGKSGPYKEDSRESPVSVYGKSKLMAEEIIKSSLKDFLIIRTSCVFGWHAQEKNFILTLIKKIKNREVINAAVDQITTPTYARDLADVSLKLAGADKNGIYNAAGSSFISRYDLALAAADIFCLDKGLIRAVKTEELSQKAKRPLNGGLDVSKIEKELGIIMPTAQSGLLRMKEEACFKP